MTQTNTSPVDILQNEHLGVLEGMLSPPLSATTNPVELVLHLYGRQEGPVSIEALIRQCHQEFKSHAHAEDLLAMVTRACNPHQNDLVESGYISHDASVTPALYAITERGMARLWDLIVDRHSSNAFDKYARVIANNKKLNDPNRHIEEHDLFALTILAVGKLSSKRKDVTSTEIRTSLESWVAPTGRNAEILPSEKSNTSPMNRFQRTFHNMFSSHKSIQKAGLVAETNSGGWVVTDKGKALVMQRTFRERRNLDYMIQSASILGEMDTHSMFLKLLQRYSNHATSATELQAMQTIGQLVDRVGKEHMDALDGIRRALETPATATAPRLKP